MWEREIENEPNEKEHDDNEEVIVEDNDVVVVVIIINIDEKQWRIQTLENKLKKSSHQPRDAINFEWKYFCVAYVL